ncbi:DUF5994 family protein [Nocardioides albus]|uniref:Uncharacterized protein n=1 Tax=Nocardioides albus TaxID=1841 RepID=A0A7W5FAI4_9ACTN|nr:DUF5994 family protein [Nocardioides albus]MBB3091210.1 hypothetical protein [Nocardioides albus]GGU33571.1 hypothetical protein GCM10007979_35730 [Nocardioides albus]
MTTSPTVELAPRVRVDLRIRLDNGFSSGPLDGAWWPQSRDLQAEAADLIDRFPHRVGRISRLLFSRPDWDLDPGAPSIRKIRAARGMVKVGSFPSDDTHLVVLSMATGERLRLLVVPHDTDPELAERIMEVAADDRNTNGPAQLLGLDGPDQSKIGQEVWDDDGGAS